MHNGKIFLPSHHMCNRSPCISRLVSLHCASHGGQGDHIKKIDKLVNNKYFAPSP